jgi:hypothetical protein
MPTIYQRFEEPPDRYLVWCARFIDLIALVSLGFAIVYGVLGVWPGFVVMLLIALVIHYAAVEVRNG